jgi:pseudo-rSAM protein
LNCQYCAEYFKQNVCCIKCNENNDILNREVLSNIISQIKNAPIGKINILGGNILQLPYLNDLQEILNEFAEQVHLWIHYENIAQNEININSFKIIIPVTFPVNKSAISKCVEKMENQVHEYRFFISNTNEYKITESIIEKYDIKSYNICPFYTQENFDFFKENIFINREDIFSEKIPFRRIFAHQKLNTNLFGSLTIVSNGNAHANVHSSVLGNIKTDSILNLIDKEMKINTAWRKIRNKKPCVDCLYQYICPSPSNYETVIGKPNLCHVQP